MATRSRYLRSFEEGEQKTSALELFFDLVFVFAVTQLSHLLLTHLSFRGAGKALLLLLVVWWAWNYTTWMTNAFDPESPVVRGVLLVLTLASLLMAIAIPQAFGDRALLFAGAYTALQVGRNLFVVAAAPAGSNFRLSFARITAWSVAVGVLLVVGALLPAGPRLALWLIALAIDYSGPAALYWLPGLGRAHTTDWQVRSSHFSERFQLFIIIALGESIVVTGATASPHVISLARGTAIAVAFIGSAALWWLYFDYVATVSQRRFEGADDRGRVARDAYTYMHIPIIAGIIVAAVADELVIAHPTERLHPSGVAVLILGPALYLIGHVGFRLLMAGSVSRKRLGAVAGVVAAGLVGAAMPALGAAALVVAVLVWLIVAELVAGHRRRARGEASPLERLGAA